MSRTEVLIAGGGLAGCVMAYSLYRQSIPFFWIADPGGPSASAAAYGIINPIHFRNAAKSWKADLFFPVAKEFYESASRELGNHFLHPTDIFHLLDSEEEAVLFRQQAECGELEPYSNGDPVGHTGGNSIYSPFGGILVREALHVDVPAFMDAVKSFFRLRGLLAEEKLDHSGIVFTESGVAYREITAEKLLFCEGSAAAANPWFSYIPFRLSKGESLTVRIPGFSSEQTIHRKIMVIPAGTGQFRVGATYAWNDPDPRPTESGKSELLEALAAIVPHPAYVADHRAGLRPGIADRRPVTGFHPVHPQLGIFNGMGSKGLMLAPECAAQWIALWKSGKPLLPEINVDRFKKRAPAV